MKNVTAMTTAELLTEYNQLTGKSVARFSSRSAGEKQLLAAREKSVNSTIKQTKTEKQAAQGETEQSPSAKNEKRSSAISETWNNKEIAQRRSTKSNVICNGVRFRSVAQAFDQLGLPMVKHIPFRGTLKQSGEAVFEHEGKKYSFKVAEGKEEA